MLLALCVRGVTLACGGGFFRLVAMAGPYAGRATAWWCLTERKDDRFWRSSESAKGKSDVDWLIISQAAG